MTGPRGKAAARPDDLGDQRTERAAFAAAMTAYAADLNARIADQIDLKAAPADIWAAIDRTAETKRLHAIILRHAYRLAQVGAWGVLAAWNPSADGWTAENLLAYLSKAADTNAGRVIDQRQAQLQDGSLDGYDDRLRDQLASTGWAAAWAVTIGTEAMGFGSHDAAHASGLGRKTWHVHATNPRPSHEAQDGETVDADDVFSNGLRWPGDHFGGADETAGCTCTLEYTQ